MADDRPHPEATTAPPPSATTRPPPFLSFLPFNHHIPSPFWQIPMPSDPSFPQLAAFRNIPFPLVNLQPHPHPQINHAGVPYVAMPMVDAPRAAVAPRIGPATAAPGPGVVQARKLIPSPHVTHPGGPHVTPTPTSAPTLPLQASVTAAMQLFAESPESTLLDPQTSPPPPNSAKHAANFRLRLPQVENHASSAQFGRHQRVYPRPLASHRDVVADRQLFISTLAKFHASLDTRLLIPKIEGVDLDLHLLYSLVTANGGLEQVIKQRKWNSIVMAFGLSTQVSNQPYFFRKHYTNLLYHYEQAYFFRREGELVQPPVPLPSPSKISQSQLHDQLLVPEEENLETTKRRRRKKPSHVELLEDDAGKLVGRVVTGAIDGKFEHGYLVTVQVGTEKLRGILYNVPIANNSEQFAAVSMPIDNVGVAPDSSHIQDGQPKKRRGRLPKKDPNAPRLNRSGYNFFFAEQRTLLKHLGSENAEVTRHIGEMWHRMTEEEKMPYLLRGQSDKERYQKEKRDYYEREKMQLQLSHGAAFTGDFSESVHETGHPPCEHEEAEQDSGDVNDTGHDYHVSLDAADLDGGDNNLQNQIYNLYVAGEHLNYGQEHLNYLSGNPNHSQEPVYHGSEQPAQEDGLHETAHVEDLNQNSYGMSGKDLGAEVDA